MNQTCLKYSKWGLTLLFGVAAFLFWRLRYPSALVYHEQWQLFLLDGDYFCSRMAQPGGVARYVAEFLVQFYNSTTFGAIILAALYMLIQRLTWRMTLRVGGGASPLAYLLSFVPVCLLWYYMGDVSVMLTLAVSLAMAAALALAWPKAKWAKWLFLVVGIPVIYWVAGPAVWVAALFILCYEMTCGASRLGGLLLGVVAVVMVLACTLLSAAVAPYPLYQLFRGLDYYRIWASVPLMQYVVMLALAAVPFLCRLLPAQVGGRVVGAVAALAVVLALFFIPKGYDAKTYELIDYDYLVRTQQWDAIIAKAERQNPDLPMSVAANNLALAMEGQLGDRMFQFFQNGVQGLLPDFERNFSTIPLTGEIYWQLGFVNTAQRFAFEAMEAIPNMNKSCRAVKRLAETNMVNGQYEVAEKYLDLLDKTVFYRSWAQRTRQLMADGKAVSEHPFYGKLRRWRIDSDYLFSDREPDMMIGQAFLKDSTNSVAMQYLLAIPMLNGDGQRLMQYMQVVNERIVYRPLACQEALAYAFAQQRQQPPPGLIDPMVLQRFNEFSQSYSSVPSEQFKGTYWYYLTAGKKKE